MRLSAEYKKIAENTYAYYDKKLKRTVEVICPPKELAVKDADIDKIFIDTLSELYIKQQIEMDEKKWQDMQSYH